MSQKRRAAANFLLGKFDAEQTREVFEILGVSTDEARRIIANLQTVIDQVDPKTIDRPSIFGDEGFRVLKADGVSSAAA